MPKAKIDLSYQRFRFDRSLVQFVSQDQGNRLPRRVGACVNAEWQPVDDPAPKLANRLPGAVPADVERVFAAALRCEDVEQVSGARFTQIRVSIEGFIDNPLELGRLQLVLSGRHRGPELSRQRDSCHSAELHSCGRNSRPSPMSSCDGIWSPISETAPRAHGRSSLLLPRLTT